MRPSNHCPVSLLQHATDSAAAGALAAATKALSAHKGNVVLVVDEGNAARMILGDKDAPVRTVICGVVDRVSMRGKEKRYA